MTLFLEIFLAAFRAVAKLFIMCAFGAFARRKNLLGKELTKNLSSLNGTIFLPCLLVTSIGASVTLEKLKKLWLLPVAACFNVVCGYVFGRVLVFSSGGSNRNADRRWMTNNVCETPERFQRAALASCTFGNALALPVVVSVAIAETGKVGNLVFTEEDKDKCVLYIGVYLIALSPLMWIVGPSLHKPPKTFSSHQQKKAATSRKAKESDGNLHLQNASNDLEEETIDNFNEDFDEYDDDEDLPEGDVELQRLTPPSSPKSSNGRFKSSSNQGFGKGSDGGSELNDENNNDNGVTTIGATTTTTTTTSPLPITTTTLRRNPSSFERLSTTISESYRKSKQVVKGFVNVNMCASISGLILGIIPFTRHLFFDTEGALYFVYRALYSMGQAAVPQVLVIIGATLANGPDHSFAPKRTAVGVLSVRFLLLPLVHVGVYFLFKKLNSSALPSTSGTDHTFWLIFLIEGCTPTASNMVLQTMMYSKEPEKAAAGVASLLFWQYLSAPFLLTGFICLFLSII
jgi:predicted permease